MTVYTLEIISMVSTTMSFSAYIETFSDNSVSLGLKVWRIGLSSIRDTICLRNSSYLSLTGNFFCTLYYSFPSLNLILIPAMWSGYLSSFPRQENYLMRLLGSIYPAGSAMPKPEPFRNSGWFPEMFSVQGLSELRNGRGRDPPDLLTKPSFYMCTSAGMRPDGSSYRERKCAWEVPGACGKVSPSVSFPFR